MFKLTLAAAAAVSALLVVDAASAQSHSTSRTRSTTTTTQDGNTTRTETRTTTTSGEVSFDADAAFDALLGMAERRSDPEYQAMPSRASKAASASKDTSPLVVVVRVSVRVVFPSWVVVVVDRVREVAWDCAEAASATRRAETAAAAARVSLNMK